MARSSSHIPGIIFTLFLLNLAGEQSLKAYVDPGSGAMFVQILLAAILGCLFRIRSIISRYRRWRNKSEPQTFFIK
jgi:hypothetical protein